MKKLMGPQWSYNLWVVVKPAGDLPDQWVAHCLDLDVVTQGISLQHAMEMAVEAISMVVEDDIASGRDPLQRRAPVEAWRLLQHVMGHGKMVKGKISKLDPEKVGVLVGQLHLTVALQPIDSRVALAPTYDVPLAWAGPKEPSIAH